MNAKRTFKSAAVRVASITLALLMVFSMGVTLLTAYAAGTIDPPSGGFDISELTGFCSTCGQFKTDGQIQDAKNAATAAGVAPNLMYYKGDDNTYYIYVETKDLCLKQKCADCSNLVKDCKGDETGWVCEHNHDYCVVHCKDSAGNSCLDEHEDKCVGGHPRGCGDVNCPICKNLTKCDKDCHDCDEAAGGIVPICDTCKGVRCNEPGDHYIKNRSTGLYEKYDKCTCIYCSEKNCNKLLAYYDSTGMKFTKNVCEHFKDNVAKGAPYYCDDHCPTCKANNSGNALLKVTPDEDVVYIPVGSSETLTFKTVVDDDCKLDISKVDAPSFEGDEDDGIKLGNLSVDSSNKGGSLKVEGLKVGDYTVTVPVGSLNANETKGNTKNAVFTVKVYDPTDIPDSIEEDLTLKINDIVNGKSYKPGDIHFGAEGSSSNKDVTVTPSNWVLSDNNGKTVKNGEFTKNDEGDFESDLKKLEKGTYNLTVKYNVKGTDGKTYVATKKIKFTVSKNSSGSPDTADNTKIYVTAFVVSLCILTFTVIGMAAYLKRKNRTAPAGHRSFR